MCYMYAPNNERMTATSTADSPRLSAPEQEEGELELDGARGLGDEGEDAWMGAPPHEATGRGEPPGAGGGRRTPPP